MFSKVMPDQLEQILQDQSGLVLIAYLDSDFRYPEQRRMLADLATAHFGVLQVYFLEGELFADISSRYGIGGAPTYILFRSGREIGRLLGTIDQLGISEFIKASIEADTCGTAC